MYQISYNEVQTSKKPHVSVCHSVHRDKLYANPKPHFSNGWTIGAFAIENFDDTSSLCGNESKHYTVQVLFHNAAQPSLSKPLVSNTRLKKASVPPKEKLVSGCLPSS